MAKNWMLVALAGLTVLLRLVGRWTGADVGEALGTMEPGVIAAGAILAIRSREWVWLAIMLYLPPLTVLVFGVGVWLGLMFHLGPFTVLVFGVYELLGPTTNAAPAASTTPDTTDGLACA